MFFLLTQFRPPIKKNRFLKSPQYPVAYYIMEVKVLLRAILEYMHREYALSVCHPSRFEQDASTPPMTIF